MQKLLDFLNARTLAEQRDFCVRCGTTIGYVRKAISVGQALGPAICVRIEQETDGAITRRDLRPEDWSLLWPELAAAETSRAGL